MGEGLDCKRACGEYVAFSTLVYDTAKETEKSGLQTPSREKSFPAFARRFTNRLRVSVALWFAFPRVNLLCRFYEVRVAVLQARGNDHFKRWLFAGLR